MTKAKSISSYFISIGMILALVSICYSYELKLDDQQETITKVNEAKIRAENKQCCQLIQERYIDRRLSEDGMRFIIDEHPRIISCNDDVDYMGRRILK